MDIKNKSENTSVEEFVSEKTELLEKIKKYEEEEKKYLEEKNRLNNLLQKLEEELKLSQKKDEEDYLISSGKENPEKEILPEVDKTIEEIPNEEKILLQ
jgi:5'-deoxynucleotidase YfbR-like HD superfamily hydrolase